MKRSVSASQTQQSTAQPLSSADKQNKVRDRLKKVGKRKKSLIQNNDAVWCNLKLGPKPVVSYDGQSPSCPRLGISVAQQPQEGSTSQESGSCSQEPREGSTSHQSGSCSQSPAQQTSRLLTSCTTSTPNVTSQTPRKTVSQKSSSFLNTSNPVLNASDAAHLESGKDAASCCQSKLTDRLLLPKNISCQQTSACTKTPNLSHNTSGLNLGVSFKLTPSCTAGVVKSRSTALYINPPKSYISKQYESISCQQTSACTKTPTLSHNTSGLNSGVSFKLTPSCTAGVVKSRSTASYINPPKSYISKQYARCSDGRTQVRGPDTVRSTEVNKSTSNYGMSCRKLGPSRTQLTPESISGQRSTSHSKASTTISGASCPNSGLYAKSLPKYTADCLNSGAGAVVKPAKCDSSKKAGVIIKSPVYYSDTGRETDTVSASKKDSKSTTTPSDAAAKVISLQAESGVKKHKKKKKKRLATAAVSQHFNSLPLELYNAKKQSGKVNKPVAFVSTFTPCSTDDLHRTRTQRASISEEEMEVDTVSEVLLIHLSLSASHRKLDSFFGLNCAKINIVRTKTSDLQSSSDIE